MTASDSYISQCSGLSLSQESLACHLFDAKPFSELALTYHNVSEIWIDMS